MILAQSCGSAADISTATARSAVGGGMEMNESLTTGSFGSDTAGTLPPPGDSPQWTGRRRTGAHA
ncbi:hypothetical protein Pen01_26590 [Phytomonospora endophytica]|nr:hypothetical protein Pen01_26590 [Phytomonospora endophytica]